MTDTDLIKIVNEVGIPKVGELISKSLPYDTAALLQGVRASGKSGQILEAMQAVTTVAQTLNKYGPRYTLYYAEGFLRCKEMIIYQPGFEDEILKNHILTGQVIYRLLTAFATDVCKELDIKIPTPPKTWAGVYHKIADALRGLLC